MCNYLYISIFFINFAAAKLLKFFDICKKKVIFLKKICIFTQKIRKLSYL